MHTITRTLFALTIAFTASTTKQIDLPRNARVQRYLVRIAGTVDTSSAAVADDGLHNLMKVLRIRRNGTDPVFALPAKYLHYMNLKDYQTRPEFVDVPASGTASGTAFSASYVIDFRANVKDPTDPYGALNTQDANSLTFEIDWGAAADLGTGYSNISATVTITQVELFMSEEEKTAVYGQRLGSGKGRERDMVLYRSYIQKTIDAAYSNYQFPIDIPAGNIVKELVLFVRRAGARDDTQVTAFRVKQNSPQPLDLLDYDWTHSQVHDRLDYEIVTAPSGNQIAKGVTWVDFVDQGNLDMRSAKKGDVQLQATTIAPSGTTDLTMVTSEWAKAKA